MPTYDVFLSHNSADKLAVEEVAKWLRDEAGLGPFLDKWLLVPGEPWIPALERAIENSATVAVFFGPAGVSGWHDEEKELALDLVHRARQGGRRIIPVLLPGGRKEDVEGFLKLRTWVDLTSDDGFLRLVAGITGQAPERLAGVETGPSLRQRLAELSSRVDESRSMLMEHRDRLVRRLAFVDVLRKIVDNDAGPGQSMIRLEDVFVCPQLVPEAVKERVNAYDRRLLDGGSGKDRNESVRYGEHVRWQSERWAAPTMSIGQALAEHRTLVVVGDPGSGKSTLLAALVLATTSEPLSRELTGTASGVSILGRIPFSLRLPQLGSRGSGEHFDLRRALADSLATLAPPGRALELVDHALRTNQALVLLDALDEVPSSVAREQMADAIQNFCAAYPQCPVIVTTREGGRTMISGFPAFHLPPMTQDSAGRLMSMWLKALGKNMALKLPTPSTIAALGELGRNPLMLLIMLITGGTELPRGQRVLFYDRALRTMFTTWRGSRDDEHDPVTGQAKRAWGEVALGLLGDDSGGVLPRRALERRLRDALVAAGAEDAEVLAARQVEEAWRKRGLVSERGDELGFWHSTFGEYLAATALARDPTLDRFVALRRDHRNVEVAVMAIDHLAHVEFDEAGASRRLRALLEQRDPWDDLDGAQIEFAVECVLRGCYARPEVIDRCFEIVFRLCQEFPYSKAHRRNLSRLIQRLPKHALGGAVLPAIAKLVTEDEPPVALDFVAVLLAAAAPREQLALAACEALLARGHQEGSWLGTRMRTAYAALGLVRAGRLEPRLFEALTVLPWFNAPPYNGHGLSADNLRAEASDASFTGSLRQSLGPRERETLARLMQAEDLDEQTSTCLLLALSTGLDEPSEVVISTLIDAATHEERTDVRDNAREVLTRFALRHPTVRSPLLVVALSAAPDSRRGTFAVGVRRDAINWAQKLLARVASASPSVLTWLVDEVARAAFRSRLESRDELALPFLRYLLHELEGAVPALDEAARRRRDEREQWPRLAAFVLLLGGHPNLPPHPELWLACTRNEDPWFRLVALERWNPGSSREAVADELVDGFVEACDHLVALRPSTTLSPDDALAELRTTREHWVGPRDPSQKAVQWLESALSQRGHLAAQTATAMWERITQSRAASSTMLAALLAEHGHSGAHPDLVDRLDAGLADEDAAAAARAAAWLTKHAAAASRSSVEELQWAMIRGSTNETVDDYARTIRGLGPPSDALLRRLVEHEQDLLFLDWGSDWLFSNPRALDLIIEHFRSGASDEQHLAAVRLLYTERADESLEAAMLDRARVEPPEVCLLLAQALEARRGWRASHVGDPDLHELWMRALASDRPSTLLAALESLRGWSKDDHQAIASAYRICLRASDAMIRIYATCNLIRWTPPELPLGTGIPKVTSILGLATEDVTVALEECLDDPAPQVQLFAISFLLGLSTALPSCERVLQDLMKPSGEPARLSIAPYAELSVVRLMARGLASVMPRPLPVLVAVLGDAAISSDAASFLHWVFFAGAAPTRLDELLHSLMEPSAAPAWPSSKDPSNAVVALAQCRLTHVREPARRAIVDALRSEPSPSWAVYDGALRLLGDPEFAADFELLGAVIGWASRTDHSPHHEVHELRQRVAELRQLASEHPHLMPRIVEDLLSLCRVNEAEDDDSAQLRTAVRLSVLLGIDDDAVHRHWLVFIATGRYEGIDEIRAEYLRRHWRELPLSAMQLLELMRSIDTLQPNACPEARAEIVACFLAAEDTEVKLDALDVWSKGPEPGNQLVLALRAWRDLAASASFPFVDGACSLALKLVERDPTADDLIAFLRACVTDPEVSMHYRLRALSAIAGLFEDPWVETIAYDLLATSEGDDRGAVANWLLDRLPPDARELPLALAHAMAQLAPTDWSPSPRDPDRWPIRDHRAVPLTNTPFDSTFARVFAELLHDDPASLRTLFDASRRRDPLSPDQRDHILRTLRVQPTDDPPIRLARRWWHHQLAGDAQEDGIP